MIDFSEEISPEDLEKLIDDIARDIVRRGLETPAVLFLESHKPLSFITSQALVVGTPLLGALVGVDRISRYSNLLNSVDNIEKLIARIEELVAEKDRRSSDADVEKDTQAEE